MLGRLISDCEYYLGYGYRDPDKLWAHDEKEQIEKIKKIWLSFSELEKAGMADLGTNHRIRERNV